MPFTPGDISAVEAWGTAFGSNNTSASILFYIDDNGELSSVQAGENSGKPNSNAYQLNKFEQVVGGNRNPVKPKSTSISAVAYQFGGQSQVRIYYIGDSMNPGVAANQLLELVNENGGAGDWVPGTLNQADLRVTANTGITANVENGSGNLKVIYSDAVSGTLRVAWVTFDETVWTSADLDPTPNW